MRTADERRPSGAPTGPIDMDMRPWMGTLTALFQSYWQTYLDPNTGTVYNTPYDPERLGKADHPLGTFKHGDPSAFAFPSDYARPDLGSWPMPEEVAASLPGANGWATPLEDAPRRGADLLTGLAQGAFALPPEERRAKAAHLYKGLVALWDVPGRTGFICRGFLPTSRAFYKQTSHHQAPYCLAGLAAYYDSELSTAAQKQEIRVIFDSVMRWMEANGWVLKHADDAEPAPSRARIRAYPRVYIEYPHVYIEFLGILALAHHVTGDAHWHDVYVRARDADGGGWCKDFAARIDGKPHPLCQFLRVLSDCESDAAWRARYDELRWSLADVVGQRCAELFGAGELLPLVSFPIVTRVRPDWRPAVPLVVQRFGLTPGDPMFSRRVSQILGEMPAREQTDAVNDPGPDELGLRSLMMLRAYRLIAADWPADRDAGTLRGLRRQFAEAVAWMDAPPKGMVPWNQFSSIAPALAAGPPA